MNIKITPHFQFTKESPWCWCDRCNLQRGSATGDLWWFVAIMMALGLVWYATGGPSRPEARQGPFIQPPAPIGAGEIYGAGHQPAPPLHSSTIPPSYQSGGPNPNNLKEPPLAARSPWYGQVSIDTGNGPYEIQPNQEYITLEANYNNSGPLTITGWSLTNAKSRPDAALIPRGTRLFIGNSANSMTLPITLAPGGRLVLVTGQMPNSDPYTINANFLTSKCTGYLDALPYYRFTPALRRSCPAPAKEPGIKNLDNECYNFVSYLSACHTPKIERDVDGNEFIDNNSGLSSNCRAFLQEHFNYNACVKWHEQDPNFYGDEWRVYLRRSWELWAPNRERITLYDQSGKIVAENAY